MDQMKKYTIENLRNSINQRQEGPLPDFIVNVIVGIFSSAFGYLFFWILTGLINLNPLESAFLIILFFGGFGMALVNDTGWKIMEGVQFTALKMLEKFD
ncbi:MAG: hypothetical protein IH886_13340 [Nitrospinae bacterium]|nr:hypothetical protein [Nitrospinota bacterium]